jgi:hypothetical protein
MNNKEIAKGIVMVAREITKARRTGHVRSFEELPESEKSRILSWYEIISHRSHNCKFVGGSVAPVTTNSLALSNYIVVNCNQENDMVEAFVTGLL